MMTKTTKVQIPQSKYIFDNVFHYKAEIKGDSVIVVRYDEGFYEDLQGVYSQVVKYQVNYDSTILLQIKNFDMNETFLKGKLDIAFSKFLEKAMRLNAKGIFFLVEEIADRTELEVIAAKLAEIFMDDERE
ncbi:hypothetical protein V6M85_00005 [Sulfolobus tengchongensis]|uniref:Uncharacterized protein n=1 Tax=Sulfolobus tengchongensis TaxID=207809 RepID=A0AAX4L088_9CREN